MKRRTGSKPTAYDKAQIYTLLIGTLGAGANPITTPLPTTPATPQQLVATAVSATRIELEWSSAGENTLTFEIESSPDNATWTQIATTNVGQTTYADVDLTAATLYYYRVRAANLMAKSPYSNVASDTTLSLFATVLDNFNRANEGPPPSASWTTGANSDTGHRVLSNACKANNAGYNESYWNAATFGPNCEAFFTLASPLPTATGGIINLYIRCNVVTYSGYMMYIATIDIPTGNYRVYLFDDSGQLGATVTVMGVAAGASFGLRIVGTTLTGYYRASGGSWTNIIQRTVVTPPAATGYILWTTGENGGAASQFVMDDFGGGNI